MSGTSPHAAEVPPLIAQPALVKRMRPHQVLTRIGLVASVLGLVASVALSFVFAAWSEMSALWPIVTIVSGAFMVLICTLQTWVWQQALAEWSGKRDVNLSAFVEPSWIAHLSSYVVGLAGLVSALLMAMDAWPQPLPVALAVAYAVLLLVAQVTAGVEYLRLDGPPGTLPAHFRRLIRDQN